MTSVLAATVLLLHGASNAAASLMNAAAGASAAPTPFWGMGAFPSRRVLNSRVATEASGSRVRRRGSVGSTGTVCSDSTARELDGERRRLHVQQYWFGSQENPEVLCVPFGAIGRTYPAYEHVWSSINTLPAPQLFEVEWRSAVLVAVDPTAHAFAALVVRSYCRFMVDGDWARW